LPETLADLEDPISGFTIPTDPDSDAPYEYNVKGDLTFELCAVFARAYEGDDLSVRYVEPVPTNGKGLNEAWKHDAGRFCFERTIDPELYPPYEDSVRVIEREAIPR